VVNIIPETAELDLTNRDREPIHIPGTVQPHGALLVLREPDLDLIQVSGNSHDVIGYAPSELLGHPLSKVLSESYIQEIQRCLAEDFASANPLNLVVDGDDGGTEFDDIVHRWDGAVILELEPKQAGGEPDFFNFYHQVKGRIAWIQKAKSWLVTGQIGGEFEVTALPDLER